MGVAAAVEKLTTFMPRGAVATVYTSRRRLVERK